MPLPASRLRQVRQMQVELCEIPSAEAPESLGSQAYLQVMLQLDEWMNGITPQMGVFRASCLSDHNPHLGPTLPDGLFFSTSHSVKSTGVRHREPGKPLESVLRS